MVLGIISASTSIITVITADTMPTAVLPQSFAAIPPIMAAPIVLAMVFSTRMEARGRSISVLYFLNNVALLLPSSSLIVR